jgi:hypothetical protein
MGVLRDSIDGSRGERPPAPTASPAPGSPPGPVPAGQDGEEARSELRHRRDELAAQVTELHWDLGGLAYEMAIRDHFRLDVLVRRAAILQERDAELAEVERLLHAEESGVAGSCPACGAPHSRGAVYCWQCGGALMARAASSAATEAGTAALDGLLAAGAEEPAGRQEAEQAGR